MVGTKVEVGGRDSPNPPFCLGREGLPLIVGSGGDDDLISMFVDCLGCGGRDLTLLLSLLLYLSNLRTPHC